MEEIDKSRRNLFRKGAKQIADASIKGIEAKVEQRAKRFIRPPFAQSELDFLLSCTRCGDCITACPPQIIFPLPTRLGPDCAGTPALDLTHKGCHLCDGWPCVTACPEVSLDILNVEQEIQEGDDTEETVEPIPVLAKATINTNVCLPYFGPECGACRDSCHIEGALQWASEKPSIDEALCVGCGLCREACIVDEKAIDIHSLSSMS